MKRIVVSGATGGLGHRACELLLERGVDVLATGRDASKVRDLTARGVSFERLDLARESVATVARLFEGADAVWHCAALSSPWGSAEAFRLANEVASQNVALACVAADVPRLVHISTPAVYFNFEHRYGVKEDDVASRFANHYARTKHAAELLVQDVVRRAEGRLSAALLRPRALFGPGDQVLLPRLLQVAESKGGTLPLPRGGRVLLDLTYLDNVVEAMWRSTAEPLRGARAYNITNGEPVQLAVALEQLFSMLRAGGYDRGWRIRNVPYPVVDVAARCMEWRAALTGREPALTRYSAGVLAYNMSLDITRARQELGYVPRVSLHEGLRRTAEALLKGPR